MRALQPPVVLAVASALALAALLLAPAATAQAAADRIVLQSDLPADGRALVGHPAHFQFLLLSAAGAPIIHQDVHVSLVQNGVVLFATEDAHDYDGTAGFDVVFPVPGPYQFTVAVPAKQLTATYDGYAVEMQDPISAHLRLEAPDSAEVDTPVTFTYANVDEEDRLLPHTDVLVEVRRVDDDVPVLQVHTHSHEDEQSFTYRFERPGTHVVRFVGYLAFPSVNATSFVPFVTTHTIDVTGEPPQASPIPALPPLADIQNPLAPEAEPVRRDLATTIVADPATGTQDQVGPYTQVRTTVAVRDDEADTLVQHTNHEATLEGPRGIVFQSSSLHEYDGALTLMTVNEVRGEYTWTIVSSRGDDVTRDTLGYTVTDPDVTRQPTGTITLFADGLDGQATGAPQATTLFAGSDRSTPFPHSEVSLQVQRADGFPLVLGKLHTHASGDFAFQAAYDTPADHTLQADLFSVHRDDTPRYVGPEGAATAFGYTVADGGPLPRPATDPVVQESPAALALLATLALVGVLALQRRR